MLDLNPIIKSHTPLPASSSAAFFSNVAPENKPPATGPEQVIPVYAIVESSSPEESSEGGGSWRGGWAKRFIPEEIRYETSMQATADGMITITHAPMGVHSVTKWKVRESGKEGEGLILEKTGQVTSNRMLMGFIKTTIQGSYEKLASDFVVALERMVEEEERVKREHEEVKREEIKDEKVPVKVEDGNDVIQTVA